LEKVKGPTGVFWLCRACKGRSATISLLRKQVPREWVNTLWQATREEGLRRKRPCPACDRLMVSLPARIPDGIQYLDVCTVCQSVWFDSDEYEALPMKHVETAVEKKLPQAAREKIALLEVDAIREAAERDHSGADAPDEWWQWIPAALGMPVEHDAGSSCRLPWVTWALTLLICAVSVVAFMDRSNWIQQWGLIPAEFGRHGGLTLVTSFFLHGGVLHLLGNVYFLMVFGDNVEEALGRLRFILLVVIASLVGDAVHIMADPSSPIPCIGASGGISGVIAFYALRFPNARLGIMMRYYLWVRWIRVSAFSLFLIWIAMQALGTWAQIAGFSNVSSLAHLGGATTGFLFWLMSRNE